MYLLKACNQIPVVFAYIKKTAISIHFGLFEFLLMLFDPHNKALQAFTVLSILLYGVYEYIDDLLAASNLEHEERLHMLFESLTKFGKRYGFGSLSFFGHIIQKLVHLIACSCWLTNLVSE